MKLSIQFSNTLQHSPVAAFIRGSEAAPWLAEISRYHLSLAAIDCYVLPQSISHVAPVGLLVVFKNGDDVAKLSLTDAYGVLAGKLYLPTHANVYPQLSEEELKKILLWPVQVFHPSIGFVGFEEKDRLDLTRLFAWTLPEKTTWRHAHAGLPVRPALQSIQVLQPSAEEVIQAVKDELDTKPLEDIPGAKESKTGPLSKIADAIKYGFFKGLLSVSKGLDNILPAGAGGGAISGGGNMDNPSGKQGLLGKIMDWVARNMDEIEKKRQTELERLSKLFDENSDEALQYAIPLNSPYLDRGQAPPSFSLSRHSSLFNLHNLGGGGRVDAWDLGNYSFTLRKKYLAAAEAAVARGDFKKAAYVHAHLLGDFYAAANVLMQGGYYRDAAALYKDHLKNPAGAAECLEKGGLLAEATAIYLQIDRLEKAGDLYGQMEEREKANACYEKLTSNLITGNDYLEASRVMKDKMGETDMAKQTLLQGWQQGNKAEACLMRYYDIVADTEKENLLPLLEKVYDETNKKDTRFLNVLAYVKGRYHDEKIDASSRKMAYEMISQQAADGVTTNLHQLKTFVPEDTFITSDTSRYVASQKKPQLVKPQETIKLKSEIKWVDATWYRNQVIAIGVHNGYLHVARANWYGNVEYYSWGQQVEVHEHFGFTGKKSHATTIILRSSSNTFYERKVLPKNKYFSEEITIDTPTAIARFSEVSIGEAYIEFQKNVDVQPKLNYYYLSGKLFSTIICHPIDGEPLDFRNTRSFDERNNIFFSYAGSCMVIISSNGAYERLDLQHYIQGFAVSKLSAETWIIVKTSGGGLLLKVTGKKMQEVASFDITSSNAELAFISASQFIAFGKRHGVIYHVESNSVFPGQKITVESPIVEIIATPHANQFGLMHENGIVSLHSM